MAKEKAVFLYIVALAGVALSFILYGASGASGPLWSIMVSPAGLPGSTQIVIAVLAAVVLCSFALLLNLINRAGFGKAALVAGFLAVIWATGPCFLPMVAAVEVTIVGTCKPGQKTAAIVQVAVIVVLCISAFRPGYEAIVIMILMLGFSLYILRLMDKVEKSEKSAEGIANRAEDMQAMLGSQRRMVKSTEHVSRLEERNRLAARIHDEIGHGMSGSILLLEGADMVMDKEPEKARETIRKVTENLRGSVEEIRKVLHEERTAGAEVSLARIENELAAFESNHQQIKTRLDTEGDMGSVSSAVWACVYENMVEALTNMLKHSEATLFRVSLKNSGALLRVEFADNGGVQRRGLPGGPRGQVMAGLPGGPRGQEMADLPGGPRGQETADLPGGPRGQEMASLPDIEDGKSEGMFRHREHGRGYRAAGFKDERIEGAGIGLLNMEERAAMCHGRCFFRSEPDGFHVVMTFPRRDGL
ncbi:MAG: histidine kinase [Clostridiales bacterium]|nr:histidine kinase [Clostridiales bacterium]